MDIFLYKFNLRLVSQKYIDWLNDKSVTRFTDQYFYNTTKRSIYKYVNTITKSNNEYLYAIKIKKNFKTIHVGNIKIGPINYVHKNAYISYLIGDKNFWGMGVATNAVKEITIIAKKKFKLKKLIAGVHSHNTSSIKVLKKCGFKKEGTIKSFGVLNKNKRFDNYIFGLNI